MILEMPAKHGIVVFKEEEFSIRVGHWGYFITHDPCNRTKQEHDIDKFAVAHDSAHDNVVIHSGECERCNKEYSTEMGGFMELLNWKKEIT
jgi:hypothetical protein